MRPNLRSPRCILLRGNFFFRIFMFLPVGCITLLAIGTCLSSVRHRFLTSLFDFGYDRFFKERD